ncbi:MAG: hypothetical protein SFU85_06745 [Candidatus Methylacidiphilales bacterium]|nr:hypothetical protein [Candidatus Methylacidiphilales bacterium]
MNGETASSMPSPKRLPPRSSPFGFVQPNPVPTTALVVFGLIFAGVGGAVSALAAGWIPSEESSFHGPRWMVGCIGFVFFVAGLAVIGMGLHRPFRLRALMRNRRLHPNQPALWDHFWNPAGSVQNRFLRVLQSFLSLLVLGAFLAPFNWWAYFSNEGHLMVRIIVGIFDLILIAVLYGALYTLVWAIKYGPARLTWGTFPLRREAVFLRWEPGRGLRGWQSGTFTLRCIREKSETVKSGSETETSRVYDCLWEETRTFGGDTPLANGGAVDLSFTLPRDAPPTTITATEPLYWELEVKIRQPGVDFQHSYLVPIYG